MNAAGFTPGPWHACGGGACKCGIVSCDDYPVAKVTRGEWGDTWASVRIVGESSLDLKAEPFMDGCMYGSVNDDTSRANACLIGAAPDLFTALRDMIADYDPEYGVINVSPDDGCMECTVGTTPRQTGPCAYHRALMALAKAGGTAA